MNADTLTQQLCDDTTLMQRTCTYLPPFVHFSTSVALDVDVDGDDDAVASVLEREMMMRRISPDMPPCPLKSSIQKETSAPYYPHMHVYMYGQCICIGMCICMGMYVNVYIRAYIECVRQ